MRSVRHERQQTLEYKLNLTINILYDIYLNISNVKAIFPHTSKKLEQIFFSGVIVATIMCLDDLYNKENKMLPYIENNTLVT